MSVLLRFGGACVRRVIDPSHAVVCEHAHDWPMISLFVIGGYRNVTEEGEQEITGPSLVFYRPGVAHRNFALESGFEQIEIEFDPAWLGRGELPPQGVLIRVGGACGALARALAVRCDAGLAEPALEGEIRRLLSLARREPLRQTGEWIKTVTERLRCDPGGRIDELARELGRSRAWIGPAYRRSVGERLQEAAARFRIERAARLLRESDQTLPAIALEAGFCDQSHMNRTFRRLLARSPMAVRQDRQVLRHGS
jgi:AraC family transcriptional regulator